MSIEEEIRNLEKESVRLAHRKDELLRLAMVNKEREARLDKLFADSGYSTPLEFVESLIRKYNLKVTGENEFQRKRKRTRVTSSLRDSIKKDCANGMSMNKASKKYELSYAVVAKILTGYYDQLA